MFRCPENRSETGTDLGTSTPRSGPALNIFRVVMVLKCHLLSGCGVANATRSLIGLGRDQGVPRPELITN